MSTIYLDPVQMDATAGAIGEHAWEVHTSAGTLESACSRRRAVALAGWLAEELHDIAVQAQMVALLYTVAALDTALRAQQIQADQSLVAAQPALVTAPVAPGRRAGRLGRHRRPLAVRRGLGRDPRPDDDDDRWPLGRRRGLREDVGPSLRDGRGHADLRQRPPARHGLAAAAQQPRAQSSAARCQHGAERVRHNTITNLLAPDGLSYVGSNTYEDDFGRSGGLGATYRDPRTGDLRF